jgi:hypothetical protein
MKKWGYLLLTLLGFVSLFNLWSILEASVKIEEFNVIRSNKLVMQTQAAVEDGYQVEMQDYEQDGIKGTYPKIVSGASKEKLDKWNQIITNDFHKILHIYSFNPFPEPTPKQNHAIPTMLKINSEVKLLNDQFLSIFYTAAYNNPYSPHPSEMVYTTNIDTKKDVRLRLPDLVKLNVDFVKSFHGWDFISSQPNNKEWNDALRSVINEMTEEELMTGLNSADHIGSDNPWDMYSYLTQEKLGISISVPHFVGDHVEFEKPYSDLKPYLNPSFSWGF